MLNLKKPSLNKIGHYLKGNFVLNFFIYCNYYNTSFVGLVPEMFIAGQF